MMLLIRKKEIRGEKWQKLISDQGTGLWRKKVEIGRGDG